jgi:hypothetical protein
MVNIPSFAFTVETFHALRLSPQLRCSFLKILKVDFYFCQKWPSDSLRLTVFGKYSKNKLYMSLKYVRKLETPLGTSGCVNSSHFLMYSQTLLILFKNYTLIQQALATSKSSPKPKGPILEAQKCE